MDAYLGTLLPLAFLVIFLIFTVYSLFLLYHWYAYGIHKSTSTIATAIYFTGSVIILFVMAGALVAL